MARKKYECDCCGKMRNHVVSVGQDYSGDPDSPDVCFFCRKEHERGRVFSKKLNRYNYKLFLSLENE